ncbi:hypothetical protein CA3LBN_001772 [Candidozyma haemuli]|uniref:Large ribosomal subunit protein uL23 N-terminal domain-containing protein n=1 Tax=Candidozyma haemuli TaxID=45357 RepID=A0ABX8I686_9ASCO|nr:hypothetical protein CA3LBN_001772 [[Candida] haemuloni]
MFAGIRNALMGRQSMAFAGQRNFSLSNRMRAAVEQVKSDTSQLGPIIKTDNERTVMWKIYAKFNKHNTICSLFAVTEDLDFMKNNEHLSYNEKVLYYMQLPHKAKVTVSAGMLGFRKSQRQEYEAGYQVSSRLFKLIEEKKLIGPNDKIEVVLSNFGKGRSAFEACLMGKESAFLRSNIVRISDNTKIKFGGNRAKAQHAAAAKKSALKGTNSKKATKVRTNTTFRLPNTLKLARKPRYARTSVPHYRRLDAYKIVESPIASETAIKKVEDGNTLVFQVSLKANKHQIKAAVKELYDVEVEKINTLVRPNGTKKAYIRLTADHDALDVANRIGYV